MATDYYRAPLMPRKLRMTPTLFEVCRPAYRAVASDKPKKRFARSAVPAVIRGALW